MAALRLSKGFSLIEVVLALGIFTAIAVFIFMGISAVIRSARFSQDLSAACLFSEGKIWEIESGLDLANPPAGESGSEDISGRRFNWEYSVEDDDTLARGLKKVYFKISWQDRGNDYPLEFTTYVFPKQNPQ